MVVAILKSLWVLVKAEWLPLLLELVEQFQNELCEAMVEWLLEVVTVSLPPIKEIAA